MANERTAIDPLIQHSEFDQAESAFFAGRFATACNIYARIALDNLSEAPSDDLAVLVSIDRLADIAALNGELRNADRLLEHAQERFAAAGNHYCADYSKLKRAQIALAEGAFTAAENLLRAMSGLTPGLAESPATAQWESRWTWGEASRGDRALFFAQYYLTAGRLAAAQGQYRPALRILDRGVEQANAALEARPVLVPLTLALASARLEEGDLLNASIALNALAAAGIDSGRHPGYWVEYLEISARLHSLRGNLGAAKRAREAAVAVCAKGGFERARLSSCLNLAYTLIFMNQTREASQWAAEARNISLRLGDAESAKTAEFLIGIAHERCTSLVASMPFASSVTSMWDSDTPEPPRRSPPFRSPSELPPSPNYLTLFEQRSLGLFLLLSRGDWRGARAYLQQMDQIFLQGGSPTDSLLICVRLAALDCILACYEGRFDEAGAGLFPTVAALRDIGAKPELAQLLRFLEWFLDRQGRRPEAANVAAEIAEIEETVVASLRGADRVIYLLSKWTVPERRMAIDIEALRTLQNEVSKARFVKKLRLRLALIAGTARLLDYADRFKGEITGREKDSLSFKKRSAVSAIWQTLRHDPRRATVAFIVLPDHIVVVRATWLKLEFALESTTRLQLRDWVRQYHEASAQLSNLLHPSASGKDALRRSRLRNALSSRRVAERSIVSAIGLDRILSGLPGGVKALTFVPDDVLHGLPFAALPYRKNSRRRVIEDFAVSLAFQWTRRRRPRAIGTIGVTVAAADSPELPPLPGAHLEREIVAAWLRKRGVPVDRNESLAKGEILRNLPAARFLHLACHGQFSPERPDESCLLIVSPDQGIETLLLREFVGLDLARMELAILTACWSADSFIVPGRWIVSLPETLWRAGAHAVLGSLWEVEDRLAPLFIRMFLDGLSAGLSREKALRQAQLKCLKGKARENGFSFRDSHFWACLTLYGAHENLAAENSQKPFKNSQ